MEACHYCGDKRCEGCPLPFSKDLTVRDLLMKIGVENNISFYKEDYYKRGKQDVILEIVWHNKIEKAFFDNFQSARSFISGEKSTSTSEEEKKDGAITLMDCLEEFERPELLDQDNKWYCP